MNSVTETNEIIESTDPNQTDETTELKIKETILSVAEISAPKKRGRKPKVQIQSQSSIQSDTGEISSKEQESQTTTTTPSATPTTSTDIQRKRGRKKKFVIESIKKLRDTDAIEDKIEFDSVGDNLDKLENKTQVSFGSLNITVHRDNPTNKHDLRKLFDDNFNLKEDEKVPTVLMQDDFEKKKEETVPKNFRVLDICSLDGSWPEKTDIWCHWCCHPFDTVPLPCPIRYNEITNKFDTVGIFCSWSCMASHSVEKYKSLTYVYMLRKMIEGPGSSDTIKMAWPKICLKSFGGSMTIEEYRNGIELGKHVYISNSCIKQVNQYILEE
jgi:hypothetical protein